MIAALLETIGALSITLFGALSLLCLVGMMSVL